MGRKSKKYEVVDEDKDDQDTEDLSSETSMPHRGSRLPWMQVMAAIGFIAIGAIVVPALWGLVAEAPNLRRYLRIMRM